MANCFENNSILKITQNSKMNKKKVTIEELENSLDDYSIDLKIKTSFDPSGNIRIDVKWVARIVFRDTFGSYLDDKYIRIADF